MDLRYLRFFIAVAEERSFTRAATSLHTVQPSLSQQIKRLEDEYVGTPLFNRDRHHVELTAAGRTFLPEARAILRSVERAIALARQAARAAAGRMVIGFVPGAEGKILAKVLPKLKAQHPEIQLVLRSLPTPEQIAALVEGSIDIGFLRPPIEDPVLEGEVVLRESIVAVVPATHALSQVDRIPVVALTALPLVQVAWALAPAVHDIADRIAAESAVAFQVAIETDNVLGTLNAVAAGLGFCLLPDYVGAICPPGAVTRPLDLQPQPSIDLMVAYRKTGAPPSLPIFLILLREWLASGEE